MNGPVKILRHPVHPMLIVFPLGLLGTAVIFDLIAMFTDNQGLFGVSYWMIAVGVVGGLLVLFLASWTGRASILAPVPKESAATMASAT